jgi:hypothetical protein
MALAWGTLSPLSQPKWESAEVSRAWMRFMHICSPDLILDPILAVGIRLTPPDSAPSKTVG